MRTHKLWVPSLLHSAYLTSSSAPYPFAPAPVSCLLFLRYIRHASPSEPLYLLVFVPRLFICLVFPSFLSSIILSGLDLDVIFQYGFLWSFLEMFPLWHSLTPFLLLKFLFLSTYHHLTYYILDLVYLVYGHLPLQEYKLIEGRVFLFCSLVYPQGRERHLACSRPLTYNCWMNVFSA